MTDTETDWYLRHRDGVEHGPFRFADILAAAKLGNIASDTCVRHEVKTLGQWVFAPRVGPIADVMGKAAPRRSQPHAARTPSQAAPTARRTSSMNVATAAPTSESAKANTEPTSSVEPIPIVRPYREQGYPVPKTFTAACVALFDFRFRWFVTPWIARILWASSLLGFLLWAGKLAYESFIQDELPVTNTAPASGVTGQWQFEPLGDQPFLQSSFIRFCVTLGVAFVAVLCIRVLCEAAIALLRAANDLHDVKTSGKD